VTQEHTLIRASWLLGPPSASAYAAALFYCVAKSYCCSTVAGHPTQSRLFHHATCCRRRLSSPARSFPTATLPLPASTRHSCPTSHRCVVRHIRPQRVAQRWTRGGWVGGWAERGGVCLVLSCIDTEGMSAWRSHNVSVSYTGSLTIDQARNVGLLNI
jgi:hypothetical protein